MVLYHICTILDRNICGKMCDAHQINRQRRIPIIVEFNEVEHFPDSKTTRVIPISSWRHKRWLDIGPTLTWVVLISEYSGVPSVGWNSSQLTLMRCVMNNDQLDHRKISTLNPIVSKTIFSLNTSTWLCYCDARLLYSSQSCPCKHALWASSGPMLPSSAQYWPGAGTQRFAYGVCTAQMEEPVPSS